MALGQNGDLLKSDAQVLLVERAGDVVEARFQLDPLGVRCPVVFQILGHFLGRNPQLVGQTAQGLVAGQADAALHVGNRIDRAVDHLGQFLLGEAALLADGPKLGAESEFLVHARSFSRVNRLDHRVLSVILSNALITIGIQRVSREGSL